MVGQREWWNKYEAKHERRFEGIIRCNRAAERTPVFLPRRVPLQRKLTESSVVTFHNTELRRHALGKCNVIRQQRRKWAV